MVIFAPDGKSFWTNLNFESLTICDTISAKVIRQLVPTRPRIEGTVFSPDRTLVVLAWSASLEAVLIDTRTGTELRRLEDCYWYDQQLVFSPDGKMLAGCVPLTKGATLRETVLRFWDVATGKRLRNLELKTDATLWFAFSADGQHILATRYALRFVPSSNDPKRPLQGMHRHDSSDDFVECTFWNSVYETQTGKNFGLVGGIKKQRGLPYMESQHLALFCDRVREFRVRIGPAGRNTVIPWPRRFFTKVLSDSSICLWDMAVNKDIAVFRDFQKGRVDGVVLAPGNTVLAVVGRCATAQSNQLRLWDISAVIREATQRELQHPKKLLETLWEDLGDKDDAKAFQAVCSLFAVPDQACSFFRQSLKPFTKPSTCDLLKLIANLDDNMFSQRQKAIVALEKASEDAMPILLAALESPGLSLEASTRIRALVDRGISRQTLRFLRAVDLLEHWASPEAEQLLATLTKGTPDAWLTREAQASYDRVRLAKVHCRTP